MPVRLNGATSGYVEVAAPDTASNATITLPNTSATLANTAQLGPRNKVINGNFEIWQRYPGGSAAVNGAVTYTADRWQSRTSSGTGASTTTRVTGTNGSRYAIRMQRNSGSTDTGSYQLIYTMETADSVPLAGQPVTLSFYARAGSNFSASSSQLNLEWREATGTDQNYFSMSGGATKNNNFTLTTSWQRFTYTTTVASATTQLGFILGFAATGTAGANDYFEMTQVQVEIGSSATPFETELIGDTLRKCMRYYEKSYAQGTAPGSSTYPGMVIGLWPSDSANNSQVTIYMKVPKRTASYTATCYHADNGSANSWVYSRSGASGSGATTKDFYSEHSFRVYLPVGAAWTPVYIYGHWVCDAEL